MKGWVREWSRGARDGTNRNSYIQDIKLIKSSSPHVRFNLSYEKKHFIVYPFFLILLRTKLVFICPNSSVQTSINDHGVRYYLYHNVSAYVIQ